MGLTLKINSENSMASRIKKGHCIEYMVMTKAAFSNFSGVVRVAMVGTQFTDSIECIQFCQSDSSAQARKS